LLLPLVAVAARADFATDSEAAGLAAGAARAGAAASVSEAAAANMEAIFMVRLLLVADNRSALVLFRCGREAEHGARQHLP
jgi:hypothetical protein